MTTGRITLAHGGGGIKTHDLICDIFAKYFSNPLLNQMGDAAIIDIPETRLAFTTDSYVVKPIFFPGGDIGKLAVCGTVNDLAVSGARPLYITAGFIIEEGFELSELERAVKSMANAANEAGVMIIAGDTKVVEKGSCDKIFINTSGIGELFVKQPMMRGEIRSGDAIIINGSIADHGMAIMASREGLNLQTSISSDCAPLNSLVEDLVDLVPDVKFMRDATRGGVATVLCEIADGQKFGIEIDETKLPINEGTLAACELLGIDPLYVANEGKVIAVIPERDLDKALAAFQSHPFGRNASIIGIVTDANPGKVTLKTSIGSSRLITMLPGDQLPRIC